ncbi:MAG: hypothetical protein B7X04_03140 [Parcubacteria group bacterium 21-54-25]|nr:MAG: hypothetical protein B7X04_03140 [Parcubacteria group bacterium 21-54-25]HQU07984.1 ROK family protein [Candidatus Paceibacterota bacterium]
MMLAVDVGGTNTRVAISRDGATLTALEMFPTPPEAAEGLTNIREAATRLAENDTVTQAALGIAGLFSPNRAELIASPHLPKWVGRCNRTYAEELLGVPVQFENDAALGALGEATFGAGRGFDIVAYITVGTGVGGARVTRGALDATHFGFEIGHQLISMNGETNELESFISGSAFKERYGEVPTAVHNPLVWEKVAQELAEGLYNTILHWSPDVLVLGGSMMKDIPHTAIIERLRARMRLFPELPEVRAGELGDHVGLYGALALMHASKATQ